MRWLGLRVKRVLDIAMAAVLLAMITTLGVDLCQADEPKRKLPTGSVALFDLSRSFKPAIQVHPSIYQAQGVSNTFMVTTDEGNVIIDTTLAQLAPLHKLCLIVDGPALFPGHVLVNRLGVVMAVAHLMSH